MRIDTKSRFGGATGDNFRSIRNVRLLFKNLLHKVNFKPTEKKERGKKAKMKDMERTDNLFVCLKKKTTSKIKKFRLDLCSADIIIGQ